MPGFKLHYGGDAALVGLVESISQLLQVRPGIYLHPRGHVIDDLVLPDDDHALVDLFHCVCGWG